jgi:hypothetical protein
MVDIQDWVCPSCADVQHQPRFIKEVGHSCGKPKKRWHYYVKFTQENEKAGATR